jgi:hypothetical protein
MGIVVFATSSRSHQWSRYQSKGTVRFFCNDECHLLSDPGIDDVYTYVVKSGRTTRKTGVGRGFRRLFHRRPLSTNPMKSGRSPGSPVRRKKSRDKSGGGDRT